MEVQNEIDSLAAGTSSGTPDKTNIANPAEPSAAKANKSHKETIQGNPSYDSTDLTEFEKQLDVIEKEFWIAAQLTKTDAFRDNFESKMAKFVNSSRNIHATLISEKKVAKDLTLPDRAIRISEIWKAVSSKKYKYRWEYKTCSSRSGFASSKEFNKPAIYFEWLNALTLASIKNFRPDRDSSSIVPKISEYFMAIEELRKAIVGIDELNIFE